MYASLWRHALYRMAQFCSSWSDDLGDIILLIADVHVFSLRTVQDYGSVVAMGSHKH